MPAMLVGARPHRWARLRRSGLLLPVAAWSPMAFAAPHAAGLAAPSWLAWLLAAGLALGMAGLAAVWARRARSAEQERWELLAGASDHVAWELEPATQRVRFSARWRQVMGAEPPATLGAWHDRVHPEDAAAVRAAMASLTAGPTNEFELGCRVADHRGEWRRIRLRGRAHRRAGRAERLAFWQIEDLTPRPEASAAFLHAALTHAAEVALVAIAIFDERGSRLAANAPFQRLAPLWGGEDAFAAALQGVQGRTEDAACSACGAPATKVQGQLRLGGDDASRRCFSVLWCGHYHPSPSSPPQRVVMAVESTDRELALDAALSAHSQVVATSGELRRLLDALPNPVFACAGARMIEANRAAVEAFGPAEEASGRVAPLRAAAGSGSAVHLDRVNGVGGSWSVEAPTRITLRGEAVDLYSLVDLTERTRVESQLRNAERIVALGGLAAGLAHEINNPLTYVIGNLELAADGVGDVSARIARALGGAVRVRQVVQQLRAMGAPGATTMRALPVGPSFESALALAAGVGLPPAQVVRAFDPSGHVYANNVWLGQIALNLISNALQVMGDLPPAERVLTLRSRLEGEWVSIDVEDSGPGVPEAMRDRIFEPFVSTRVKEDGTGLGLYICRELAGRMGGELRLTRLSPGAIFTLRLPHAALESEPAQAPLRPSPPRRGRVLVVDDEESLGELFQVYLSHHEVVYASQAAQARRALAEGDWDAVVLDVVIPGASGIDLWRELAAVKPEAGERVIFVTGGSMTPSTARFLLDTGNVSLVKPFDFRELVAQVDRIVGARRRDA